jgi:hypothetical protein
MSDSSSSVVSKISQFISVISHPLLVPLYTAWILLQCNTYLSYAVSPKLQDFLYLFLFVISFLLPAALTWLVWQKGWVSSLELENRKERTLPLFLTLCCYMVGIYLLFYLPLPRVFLVTMIGATIALLVTLLINLRWKISMHMIGAGGLFGLFYGFSRFFHLPALNALLLIAIASGLIATARFYRGSHTAAQIYMGFLLGFFLEFGVLFYFAPAIIGR